MTKSKTAQVIEKMRESGWRFNCELDSRGPQFFLRRGYDNTTVIEVSKRVAKRVIASEGVVNTEIDHDGEGTHFFVYDVIAEPKP